MDNDQTQDDTSKQDPQDDQSQVGLGKNPQDDKGNTGNQDLVDPDDAKHQQAKPPSVTGEEDISGDMPAESPDLDEEIEKTTGKKIDPERPEPLGEE